MKRFLKFIVSALALIVAVDGSSAQVSPVGNTALLGGSPYAVDSCQTWTHTGAPDTASCILEPTSPGTNYVFACDLVAGLAICPNSFSPYGHAALINGESFYLTDCSQMPSSAQTVCDFLLTSAYFSDGAAPQAPPSTLTTPVFASFQPPTSGTATYYSAPAGSSFTTALGGSTIRQVPIPIAGTIKGLYAAFNTAQPGATIADWLGGAAGSVACSFGGTTSCNYSGSGDHISAGTLMEWQWSTTSTWAQTSGLPVSVNFLFTADSGQQGFLLSGPQNTAASGTAQNDYAGFGSAYAATNSGNESAQSSIMPVAGQITGLYVVPNGTENSTPHVYTIWHNGSASSMTCTPGASTSTGCCVNLTGSGTIGGGPSCTTTSAISIAVGDTLSIDYGCAGAACANVSPGVALIFVPTTAGQAPLVAQWDETPGTLRYVGLEDGNIGSAAGNYQAAPNVSATVTLSDLLACAGTSPGAGGTWIVSTLYAATPSTPPATSSGIATTVSNTTNCPGASSALYGAQDTAHTFSAGPGYSLINQIADSGSPVGSNVWKIGMVATVP